MTFYVYYIATDSDEHANEAGINFKKDTIDLAGMASIHSLASMLMWVKFIYFLRIFKSTGRNHH